MQSRLLQVFKTLAATQDDTQNVFVGTDWLARARTDKRITDLDLGDRLPIRFLDAALSEIAVELLPCTCPIAWWKKASPPNLENANVELVDAMHFMLCENILRHVPTQRDIPEVRTTVHELVAKDMLNGLKEAMYMEAVRTKEAPVGSKPVTTLQLREGVKDLMTSLLSPGRSMSYLWADFWNVALLVHKLREVNMTAGLKAPDTLAAMYIAKGALNRVRQEKGDKKGLYARMWDGVEDNVHVMEKLWQVLDAGGELPSVPALKQWIEGRYQQLSDLGKLEIIQSH